MMDINKALILFSDEYGSFPNDETGALLAEKYPNIAGLNSPKTSNDYFKQMVVAGYLDEDVIADLSKLERGVAYVVWQEKVPTESAAPLLVSPMVDGEKLFDWKYSKKHTKRSAMIARADGSVTTRRMLEDVQVYYGQNPKVGFFESYGIPWWDEQE